MKAIPHTRTSFTQAMEENLSDSKNSFNSVKYRNNVKKIESSSVVANTLSADTVEGKVRNTIKNQVHVKFRLDSEHNMRSLFKGETTFRASMHSVADTLDVDEEDFVLKLKNKEVRDSTLLGELIENPLVPVNANLEFKNTNKGIEKFTENIPSLNVITVHMTGDKEFIKHITVVIEDHSCQKHWLGGYRSKLNGKEYHHAIAQTSPKYTRVRKGPVRFHRDTQTVKVKSVDMATMATKGTQMWRQDHYVMSNNDNIIVGKSFTPFSKYKTNLQLDVTARVIQNFWRICLLKRKTKSLILSNRQRIEDQREFIERVGLEHSEKERNWLIRAAYPVTRDDFFLLYLTLGKGFTKDWNIQHHQRTEFSRKAKNYLLLTEEIKSLFVIEKHKISHKKEFFKKKEIKFLEMTACPKVFTNKSGSLVTIDDIETQRARQFMEIYSELIKRDIKPTDRIYFLKTLKPLFTTNYITYEYADEIISLVDREILFLTMGTRSQDLKGLRMRIEQLFLHFVQQEEFNPKAAKLKMSTSCKLFECMRCRKLLPASKFPTHFRIKEYSICTSCRWLNNIGHIHSDLGPYRKLLEQVRQDEMDKCCQSSICFLLQPQGMIYLTLKIWHNHSAISESSVMTNLRHVRWKRDMDWAPWNTILLTAEESEFHVSIPDVHQFYHPSFIKMVHNRHIMARNHFRNLELFDYNLSSTGSWTSSANNDPYLQKHYAKHTIDDTNSDII